MAGRLTPKGATFTANSISGKATLNSGTSLSPVATVNVSFVPKKKKVSACPVFGTETVFTGTVKGSVHIVTGTKPVSITLSSKAASFTSEGTSTLTVSPCLFSLPCFGDGWSAPESSTGIPFGKVGAAGIGIYEGKSLVYSVTVIRQTELKKATAFIREDEATQDVSAPKWNAKSKTLTVGASGIVTGSGVLTGGKGSRMPHRRLLHRGQETQRDATRSTSPRQALEVEGVRGTHRAERESHRLLEGSRRLSRSTPFRSPGRHRASGNDPVIATVPRSVMT